MGKRRGRPLGTKNKKTTVHVGRLSKISKAIKSGKQKWTIHNDTQTESDDELIDIEQNIGSSNDHALQGSVQNQAPLETANEMDIVDDEFAGAVNENSENEGDSWKSTRLRKL
ncbi:hypothetical protein BJV82DRAFT_676897 [Fennellomyces sp. T-0311]|nr:hypothetical protein BJV82DRAFT_676897 [Fennellomyces sp. T-0311]